MDKDSFDCLNEGGTSSTYFWYSEKVMRTTTNRTAACVHEFEVPAA